MNIKDRAKRYKRAEITIVALHDMHNKKYYNIYSVVELCPADQMPSPVIGKTEHGMIRKTLNDNYTLYIRRVFFTEPLPGINFFLSSELRTIYKLGPDDVLYDYDEMIAEPDGQEGILYDCSSADGCPLKPVLPEFTCSVRVYTKISKSSALQQLLTPKELIKAGLAIKNQLGISLLEHMEYWGSVFLCLPNPYIRQVRLSLGRDCKFLLIHIQERENSSILDGTFEITDERNFGTGFFIRKQIDDTRFWIEMPNEPEKLRYRVYTKTGELVAEAANHFVKSFKFRMAIEAQRRIFNINDQVKEMPMQTYEEFNVGDSELDAYAQRLDEEEKKRTLKYLEDSRTFVYFPGNKEDSNSKKNAERIIQELVNKAKTKCIICDPYFSAEDFITFGTSVSSLDLELQIVTSEAFLIQPLSKKSSKTQGDKLIKILNQVKSNMKVQCYVLQGRKNSPLHDRFIIVDDNAYLLGSSLSEFGSRATTLFKVPDPDALDRQARKWMYDKDKDENKNYCITIDEWAKKEHANDKKIQKKSRGRLKSDVQFKKRIKRIQLTYLPINLTTGLNRKARKGRING